MSRGVLRRSLSDATFLFAVPITAALLPWRLGFALLRRLARSDALFADEVDAAWRQANANLPGLAEARFKHGQRLTMLVDRCDSYLTVLHGARWWARRIDIQGEWPVAGASVHLTAHWGAGHWIWRLLQAHAVDGWFLARRAGIADVGRGRLARGYLRWRRWALPHIGCRGPIFTGGSGAELARALAAGDCVIGMLDVPAAPQQRTIEVRLLRCRVRLPRGLAEIAAGRDAPVSVFTCGLDIASGRRKLVIDTLAPGATAEAITAAYAQHLGARIEDAPGAWHMWSAWPALRAVAVDDPDCSAP